MKYKNTTTKILRFRAHEPNGVKTSFVLKPNEKVDLYKNNLDITGLEKAEGKSKSNKKTKKGDE